MHAGRRYMLMPLPGGIYTAPGRAEMTNLTFCVKLTCVSTLRVRARQAIDADESALMSRSVALQLAERLLLKMVSQNKLEAEAEVQLYLIVLEKQVRNAEHDCTLAENGCCVSLPYVSFVLLRLGTNLFYFFH